MLAPYATQIREQIETIVEKDKGVDEMKEGGRGASVWVA
ncbi:hypothetical protein T06_12124 [Trichinella sp. T6]|nr:hypothetical protein T06_12124 [Trichinella sp. T6]